MNQTLTALSEIIKRHPLEEKLLFVPSYSMGHQIGELLSRSGTSWINLRATTVSGYAHEVLALEIGAKGIRLIDFLEELLIVEKIYHGKGNLKPRLRNWGPDLIIDILCAGRRDVLKLGKVFKGRP